MIHQALAALGHRHALIGGLAVQFWGQPRLTRDVDVTVLIEPGHERKLPESLARQLGVGDAAQRTWPPDCRDRILPLCAGREAPGGAPVTP